MQIISVVRDFDMYNRLVKDNPFYPKGAVFTAFDNNKENLTIPIRYNSFLDDYDYSNEDWFVFCHEDWEVKEELEKRLKSLDKNSLYGPIGISFNCQIMSYHRIKGQIKNSHKDGSEKILIGYQVKNFPEVGTFDCQCLIVHSSLIKKYKLRFDENLTWDLYVEDFCISARENHAVPSKILQLNCQHYSFGNVTERFYKQHKYLQNKYINSKNTYITVCSDNIIGKTPPFFYRILKIILIIRQKIFTFFYQKKLTKSGILSIKIFKIPVYRKKVK